MSDKEKPRLLTAITRRVKARFATRRAIALMLLFAAIEIGGLIVAWTAFAGSGYGVRNTVCVGGYSSAACSTNWRYRDDYGVTPARIAPDPHEEAAALERDRKWVARCRPVVRADRFGVNRYVYAAPGCEFGRAD